jgi:hypothetical protein
MVLPLFSPYVEIGEIANLPTYSFYARIAAIRSQEPMSGITLLLEDDGNADIAERVIKQSRKKYAKKIDATKPVEVKPDESIKPEPVQKTVRHKKTKTSQSSKQYVSTSSEAKSLI